MADLSLIEAINLALHAEMARDPEMVVLGEDIGRNGGVFRATLGLLDAFGPERVNSFLKKLMRRAWPRDGTAHGR
mgnify:CR=1 FL=1